MSPRSTARIAGWLFLLTHLTSVSAVILYGTAAGPLAPLAGRWQVLAGAMLEVVLGAAVVGTAVALYPLLRAHRPGLAMAYVGLRTLEAGVILVGVVTVLPVVAVPASPVSPGLEPSVAQAFTLAHAWSFVIGPGLICPINTVVLAWLLLRTGLVPRPIAILGLIGGPVIGVANLLVVAGLMSTPWFAALPIFAWEIALAIHLIVRGLRPARGMSPGTGADGIDAAVQQVHPIAQVMHP